MIDKAYELKHFKSKKHIYPSVFANKWVTLSFWLKQVNNYLTLSHKTSLTHVIKKKNNDNHSENLQNTNDGNTN